MAKITLLNHRKHQITINHETAQVVVPPATVVHDDNAPSKRTTIPGSIVTDDGPVLAAQKKSNVVKHYFDEKWLEIAKSGPAKPAPKDED